jgi:hypothetical protein
MESWAEMRPSALAFSTSFGVMAERTKLVAEEFLAMAYLLARCFTRIYQICAWGYARKEKEARSTMAAVAERKSW